MKSRLFLVLFIIVAVLYFVIHYISYGSFTRSCIYTENILPVPPQLMNGRIIVAKDAYVVAGKDKEYDCLKNFGKIEREIVNPEAINDNTIGRKYYTSRGLSVESLKKGTSFQIEKVIAVTTHGISNIDAGPGPIYFLVLKDENNIIYQVATVFLGMNKDDLFLSYVDRESPADGSVIQLLDLDSFETTSDSEGENSISYTGKLSEVSNDYLKNTEPQWKKMSDRLERGENFLIMITIELRDDSFREMVLSDDSQERTDQIAKIQKEFLQQIPDNIKLENLENDQYHPYITMSANLGLLNYLVDNRLELKIKSISELTK